MKKNTFRPSVAFGLPAALLAGAFALGEYARAPAPSRAARASPHTYVAPASPLEEKITPEMNLEPTTPPPNYKVTDFSQDTDQVLLARMIWGEARGQSDLERVAVAYTAVNRANDGKKWNGETVREAVLKPWQYSCFNSNDPNRDKLLDPQQYDAESFRECLDIAGKVLSGEHSDPTNGATHYFNPKVVLPTWAKKMSKIGKINVGNNKLSAHDFYRED